MPVTVRLSFPGWVDFRSSADNPKLLALAGAILADRVEILVAKK
jgi:hypothetical protein